MLETHTVFHRLHTKSTLVTQFQKPDTQTPKHTLILSLSLNVLKMYLSMYVQIYFNAFLIHLTARLFHPA